VGHKALGEGWKRVEEMGLGWGVWSWWIVMTNKKGGGKCPSVHDKRGLGKCNVGTPKSHES
jgi:hypothetical protein